jgi:hypothetical protein
MGEPVATPRKSAGRTVSTEREACFSGFTFGASVVEPPLPAPTPPQLTTVMHPFRSLHCAPKDTRRESNGLMNHSRELRSA